MSEKYYNVDIYNGSDKVGKPCFELDVIEKAPTKPSDLVITHYKVTLSSWSTQTQYDKLQMKVFDALNEYNTKLELSASTILFTALKTYRNLVEVNFEQDDIFDSQHSIHLAKPLAEIFRLIEEDNMKKRDAYKQVVIHIGNREVSINDKAFTGWLIKILKSEIIEGNYSLDYGMNMVELQEALKHNSLEQLKSLETRLANCNIVENSQLITSFCLSVHKLICFLLDQDVNKVNSKQLKLYRLLLSEFKIPYASKYFNSDKKGNDRFSLLLKRALATSIR